MVMQVKCFTCGEVLGNKFRYFIKEVAQRKRRRNANVTMSLPDLQAQSETIHWADRTIYLTPNHDFSTKTIEDEVLDQLCLESICCRTALLTQLEDNNF